MLQEWRQHTEVTFYVLHEVTVASKKGPIGWTRSLGVVALVVQLQQSVALQQISLETVVEVAGQRAALFWAYFTR